MRSVIHAESFLKVREMVDFINEYCIDKSDIVSIHYGDESITLLFYGRD